MTMKLIIAACAAVTLATAALAATAGSEVSSKIKALYAGFDPSKDPLEIEMVKEWDEGDIHIEQLYFTGEITDGVKTRVYAYRGAPRTGKNLPGILYCHGGGQTAYLEWVRFWAKRGYVCVSFDFSGDTNKYNLPEYKREHFTKWGAPVEKIMLGPAANPGVDPLKCDSWYHFTNTARRSLTLLESHPRVNPDKLGAYGVSAGGYMAWLLAAADSRVKTIVPIYGAGYALCDSSGLRLNNPSPDVVMSKFNETPSCPGFYAPLITVPVLYMTATNDGSFNLDNALYCVDALGSATVRQLYTPRSSHHMEPPESKSLPMWMDWQLKGKGGPWPRTPGVEIASAGGVPRIRVTTDDSSRIEKVDVYYCLNDSVPTTRYWRLATPVRKDGDSYVADAPFMTAGDRIFAFANVAYGDGREVSSKLVEANTALLQGVKPTLQREALVDSMGNSDQWHWVPAYPDPKIYEYYLKPWTGPAGERGFTVNPFECDNPPFVNKDGTLKFYFATRRIGDPEWRGGADDKALLLDYYAPRAPSELTVILDCEAPKNRRAAYSAKPEVKRDAAGFVTLRFDPSSFKDADGNPLSKWDGVRSISLTGVAPVDSPPVFKNLRWDRR